MLPVNAYVLLAKEPVLIDSGLVADREGFMDPLTSIIDPKDLRWVWLTHDDADHTGNIQQVFDVAPQARLAPTPSARCEWDRGGRCPSIACTPSGPGDRISVGDRTQPTRIFSSHLPAATGTSLETFLGRLESVPDAEPAVPPNSEEFAQMVAAMTASEPRVRERQLRFRATTPWSALPSTTRSSKTPGPPCLRALRHTCRTDQGDVIAGCE